MLCGNAITVVYYADYNWKEICVVSDFISSLSLAEDVTLEPSGYWLGTRIGAGGTATLA